MMVAYRSPGMDHDLYPYSALPDRPSLLWPGQARLAVGIVLYLEHWELEPPAVAHRDPRFKDPFGDYAPDYRTYTIREYGNRVGIFRVLDVLDRLGWPVTVAANSSALDRYGPVVERCLERGWTFAAHGTHATRMVTAKMDEDEEIRFIKRATDTVRRVTGQRPLGWIAQDFGETVRSPHLLAEAGYRWIGHWPNDDRPYWMTTVPPLLSIPCHAELDDVQLLWCRRVMTHRYPQMVGEAVSVLASEGPEGGRSFVFGIHPWLFGMPHRIRYLGETLDRIAAHEGLWPASLDQIADHVAAETLSDGDGGA